VASGVDLEDQVAAMLGGGQSVGGVVSDTVGNTREVTRHATAFS